MAVIDVERHHQDLVDELIAAVEEYNPGVDKDLLARAFRFAATAHEGQTVAFDGSIVNMAPHGDYDTRYDVPSWTKDQFVEAVYRSLSRK